MKDTIPRHLPIEDIDPDWAWSPWQASPEEAWDLQRATHLFRRAVFGANSNDIHAALRNDPSVLVKRWLNPETSHDAFENESKLLAKSALATGDSKQLAKWWLFRMLNSPEPFREKMTLFWHGHFATSADKVRDVELMYEQNNLLRQNAMGNFRTMVHAISRDPAMLIYLDSAANRKAHPNENYARELMELFCLGEGNYSESDVQHLARCFTGWEIRRKRFRFNGYQHDDGEKRLFGNPAIFTGEQAIDQVLDHPSLPTWIVSRLFRFFICDEPLPEQRLLRPLVERFRNDHLELSGVLQILLSSRLMLSNWCIGRKIRSPIDMALGFLNTMEASTSLDLLSRRLHEIGHSLFFPPNVKGWEGGRSWINSSTLLSRANLIHQIAFDDTTRFGKGDMKSWLVARSLGDPTELLKWFQSMYLAIPLREQQKDSLTAKMVSLKGDQATREMLSLIATLPNFHIS